MPFKLNICSNISELIESLSFNIFQYVQNTDQSTIFNPIKVVTQTEGLKKYIGYQVSLKNASLFNYQSFNLTSFFVDILDLITNIESPNSFESPINLKSSSDSDKKSKANKSTINHDFSRIKENVSWFLFFYLKFSCDDLLFKGEKLIDTETNVDDKLLNFSLFFSDLFEQYETYRDLDKWIDLQNIDLKEVDLKILIKKIIKNDVLSAGDQSYLIKMIIEQNDITRYSLKSRILSFVDKIQKNMLEKEKVEKFSKIPVYFIGIDSIPLIYLDILIILSRVMTINFYFLLPEYLLQWIQKGDFENYLAARDIIDEKKTLNTLYQDAINNSNIGRSCTEYIKDFISFFIYYLGVNDCEYQIFSDYNSKKNLLNINEDAKKKSLLTEYKRFISNSEISQTITEDTKELNDDSIQIFSCYTNLRELEVTKDRISEILKNNEDISVEDIVILTPDPQKYLPFIDYVFSMQEPRIPVKTTTRFSNKTKKLLEVLLSFLDLMESRFEKSKFFDFISLDLVKEKFKITSDDISTFSSLCETYLWGTDREDIVEFYQENIDEEGTDTDTSINLESSQKTKNKINFSETSFDFGFYLESIFLKVFLGFSSKSFKDDGIDCNFDFRSDLFFCNREINIETLDLVGKFYNIFNLLYLFYKEAKVAHECCYFAEYFHRFFDTFYPKNIDYVDNLIFLKTRVLNFFDSGSLWENAIYPNASISSKIAFDFVRQNLKSYGLNIGYAIGYVNFSNIIEFRNIPKKVIFVIGMDTGSFPENEIKNVSSMIGNELIKPFEKELPTDRKIREMDKYLFYETIMAAQRYFIVTYQGKDPLSNKDKAPSILVSLMLEDINRNLCKNKVEIKPIQKPLQPFSEKYIGQFRIQSHSNLPDDSINSQKEATFNINWVKFKEKLEEQEKNPAFNKLMEELRGAKTLCDICPYKNFDRQNIENKDRISLKTLIDFVENPIAFYIRNTQKIYLDRPLQLFDYEIDVTDTGYKLPGLFEDYLFYRVNFPENFDNLIQEKISKKNFERNLKLIYKKNINNFSVAFDLGYRKMMDTLNILFEELFEGETKKINSSIKNFKIDKKRVTGSFVSNCGVPIDIYDDILVMENKDDKEDLYQIFLACFDQKKDTIKNKIKYQTKYYFLNRLMEIYKNSNNKVKTDKIILFLRDIFDQNSRKKGSFSKFIDTNDTEKMICEKTEMNLFCFYNIMNEKLIPIFNFDNIIKKKETFIKLCDSLNINDFSIQNVNLVDLSDVESFRSLFSFLFEDEYLNENYRYGEKTYINRKDVLVKWIREKIDKIDDDIIIRLFIIYYSYLLDILRL